MSATAKPATRVKQEPGLRPSPVKIKQEPGASPKPERLQSFRVPRDLTLGGAINPVRSTRGSANKKVYTPNLNAVRNKNADVKTSRDTTGLGRGRGRGERRTDSTRGRGAKTSALVQMSGLFSEGTGEAKLRRSSSVFDRNSNAGDSASSLRRPTLVKREAKLDPAVERKNIQEILGELDDDFEDVSMDTQAYGTGIFSPIALHEIKSETKPDIPRSDQGVSTDTAYPQSLDEFFSRQQQQLFLIQLPDTLPGHGSDEPAESASAENANQQNDPTANYCTMRHLDEGLLGKLVRYKSGKTKLLIGASRFDVDLGMEPGLLQEVMTVHTDAQSNSGELINLGPIQAKLSAIPDWEYIFREAEAAKNVKTPNRIGDSGA